MDLPLIGKCREAGLRLASIPALTGFSFSGQSISD